MEKSNSSSADTQCQGSTKQPVRRSDKRRLNEICRMLQRRIAAKFRMHLIGSLMKLNGISGVLTH